MSDSKDTRQTYRMYVRALVIEAALIALLTALGRYFS